LSGARFGLDDDRACIPRSVVNDDNLGWRVERLEQNVEALEQDRDGGLLVEDRRGFAALLRAKVQTPSGKGLNKGFARTGRVQPLLRQRFV
jgi:hypothetical protein